MAVIYRVWVLKLKLIQNPDLHNWYILIYFKSNQKSWNYYRETIILQGWMESQNDGKQAHFSVSQWIHFEAYSQQNINFQENLYVICSCFTSGLSKMPEDWLLNTLRDEQTQLPETDIFKHTHFYLKTYSRFNQFTGCNLFILLGVNSSLTSFRLQQAIVLTNRTEEGQWQEFGNTEMFIK